MLVRSPDGERGRVRRRERDRGREKEREGEGERERDRGRERERDTVWLEGLHQIGSLVGYYHFCIKVKNKSVFSLVPSPSGVYTAGEGL